jgi:hypothetical protein
MAQNFRERTELPLTHLFDGTPLNVYDKNVINLSAGAPGPNLLKECCGIFQTATEHRMVRIYVVNNIFKPILSRIVKFLQLFLKIIQQNYTHDRSAYIQIYLKDTLL